jgi:hypothetical protein
MANPGKLDKVTKNGTVVQAPEFTRRVIHGVPVLFQYAEWLAVIAVFQYADVKFHFMAARVVWIGLGLALSIYTGVLCSNLAWRYIEDPFSTRIGNMFMSIVLPLVAGGVVFFLLKILLVQIVASH